MPTPFFPSWRSFLAPLGPRSHHAAQSFDRATLSHIELSLSPALPADLLEKPPAGPHSRRRLFPLVRTFWCWIWQIFQANTSCRQVVQMVQALLGVLEQPEIDPDGSAYCQARAKLSLGLLERALSAVFHPVLHHRHAFPHLRH